MKRLNLNPYAALLMLVALFTACSGSDEHSATSNSNVTQQANSNAAAQPQVAQDNAPVVAPSPAPPAVQSIPPLPPPAGREAAMANQSAADAKNASTATNARVPKLVVPDKKIDYGKQPQGKTLVRAIVIKNGGRADLNIEAVVPT